jgi:DNA-directed RNA polymerase specialized sigma24 family protein
LTDSQRSELVERYVAGKSSHALAREFGVDRRTATRVIRKAGVGLRYRADLDVDSAHVLYESGLSLAKVGDQLGASSGTILNLMQRAGVPPRDVGTNQWSERATAPSAG